MKTEKMSFKNIKDVLSRDEMKRIMAGSGRTYCQATCNDGTGAWTGYYSTYSQIGGALNSYCSGSGGSYYCNGALA